MMTQFDLPLWGEMGDKKPYLHAYLQEPAVEFPELFKDGVRNPRPTMVVMPGGGYMYLSPREAEPIALAYAAKGFNTFVLYYSLYPVIYPQPLFDAAQAMTLIRDHAEEWNVDPQRIAVCGFSAGGHLAGALATCWKDPVLVEKGFDPKKIRPDAAVLSYAAVACGKGEVLEKFADLFLGENKKIPELATLADCTGHVDSETCPCFLWQTANDKLVPVASTLSMAGALAAHQVPFEVHIYPDGPHGLALATRDTAEKGKEADQIRPDAAAWMDLSIRWLEKTWKFEI